MDSLSQGNCKHAVFWLSATGEEAESVGPAQFAGNTERERARALRFI